VVFTVVLVGRPNVGKSTLFNRLLGRKAALVHNLPGVTRDRREAIAERGDLRFRLIDTAGLEDAAPDTLSGRMRQQSEAAVAAADLVLLMIDARTGVTSADEYFAAVLRASGKPVVLLANKAEPRSSEGGVLEGFSLGLGEPIAISAEHGIGLPEVYDRIRGGMAEAATDGRTASAEEGEGQGTEAKPLLLAVIGQPNAGKSTLVNRLLGKERMLTGPEPGITRDAISVDWQWQGRAFRLVDTAGIRRKSKVVEKLEKLSVSDALRAIRFAEVVILVMDATAPLEKQDLQLADVVAQEGRALVLALNKWDLVERPADKLRELNADLNHTLIQIRGVPMVPISALTGEGLEQLMSAVLRVYDTWNARVPTAALNRWLATVSERHPPPAISGRRITLKYLTQSRTRPPTFYLSCSRPEALPDAYKRYLVNGLREKFRLSGVPIRLMLRRDENPYERRDRGPSRKRA
jgi:GTP-binding protein